MSKNSKTWSDDVPDDDFPPMGGRPAPRLPSAGNGATQAPAAAPAKSSNPWAAKPTVAAAPLREVMSQEPVSKPEPHRELPAPRDSAPQRDDARHEESGGYGGGRDGYQRREYNDRPPREYNDRPPREYNDRPPREYNDRPREYADRPPRDYSDRPPREEVPIPDVPPFRAYVGKIPKETEEADIAAMFASIQLECTNIVVMRHQDTHNAKNAFVTFGSREDLVQALTMNNFCPYDGAMPMVVAPASAPPAGREARPERRGGGSGFFDRSDRYGGDSGRDWSDVRSGAQQPSGGRDRGGDRGDRDRPYGDRAASFGSQRPALNLQPRTLPVEAVAAPIAPTSSKSNPFGDAKPITDEERERRMQAAKAEREKFAAAAPAPAKERSPPPARKDGPGPKKEGGAFQSRRDGGSDRRNDGPWERGIEQKPRGPRDGPAADPMSPGWNAAKPSGKRFGDRPAAGASASGAAAGQSQQAAKGDAKSLSNPFAALAVDSPTADAED